MADVLRVPRTAADAPPTNIIRPSRGWVAVNVRELWEFRELLYILIWRDLKVRYKRTAIGAAWVVIQPLTAMLIFTLIFGRLAKIPSGGLPYPVFAYAGLLAWQFFAKALSEASTSLVVNERVITKIYFPRLLVPSAVVLAGLVDLAVAFVLLIGLMAIYGIAPTWAIAAVPAFVGLALLTALGVSFWLSALDVEFRDVRYTLPFLTQLWFFATPVVYPATLIPPGLRALYGLNPMVGVVEGFRWSLLGAAPPDPMMLTVSCATVAALFAGGVIYFRRMERTLADRI